MTDAINSIQLKPEAKERIISRKADPRVVLERIVEVAEKQLGSKLKPGAGRQRVIATLVGLECDHSLDEHIGKVKGIYLDDEDEEYADNDREARIAHYATLHDGKWAEDGDLEDTEVVEIADIDKAVHPGGITELMMAAMNGDLDIVKELVEEKKADTSVRCNSGLTAYERARDMGYKAVSDYLFEHPR